jgi:hypothetical protein
VISNFKTINGVGYALAFNFCQNLQVLPPSCSSPAADVRAALVSPDGATCYVMSAGTDRNIDYQMTCKREALMTHSLEQQ